MDIEKLKNQLRIDEGVKYCVYLDSEGLLTCGVGHLLTEKDIEYKQYKHLKLKFDDVKLKIKKERVEELLDQDVSIAIKDCCRVFDGKKLPDFNKMPDELCQIIANMMFNLGCRRFLKFRRFIKAIKNKDLCNAAHEMEDSKWYKQVGNRSIRLKKRMLALANCNIAYSTL